MLTAKPIIYGKVIRIAGKMIYVQRGETMDAYNSDWYLVVHSNE
jgi:hypothetical protein